MGANVCFQSSRDIFHLKHSKYDRLMYPKYPRLNYAKDAYPQGHGNISYTVCLNPRVSQLITSMQENAISFEAVRILALSSPLAGTHSWRPRKLYSWLVEQSLPSELCHPGSLHAKPVGRGKAN